MFYYLSLAAALFAVALYGIFASSNFPGKLVGLFLMMNAIVINLAAFDKFVQTGSPVGLVVILFTLIIAFIEFLMGMLICYQWLTGAASAEQNNSGETLK